MKLKPRTTYINGLGQRVCIAGLARRTDIKGAFWSIQGDHYTSDGKFVVFRALRNSALNIMREDTSVSARRWWNGVKTR